MTDDTLVNTAWEGGGGGGADHQLAYQSKSDQNMIRSKSRLHKSLGFPPHYDVVKLFCFNTCRGDRGYMLQGLLVTVAIFLERPLLDSQFIYRTCAPNS